ncbi:acetolactate synthase AlsS [Candidatus Uhrbacteria bacterium]|nr:acetolactate synthase AlsS [Candidatus Uhrbacteria bacterium]
MKKKISKNKLSKTGAEIIVECLRAQGVKYIFGIPGAAIMPILEELRKKESVEGYPKFILCRHEQNAAFMAACWGRLTGYPGVVLVTNGPGATNIVTGVATATADRDPLVALTGSNPLAQHMKKAHQSIHTRDIFNPITKRSIEVEDVNSIPEVIAMAFDAASSHRQGGAHITFPLDIQKNLTSSIPIIQKCERSVGVSPRDSIKKVMTILQTAKYPVLLLGVGATHSLKITHAVRKFIKKSEIPTVGTFEAAGAVSRELLPYFVGRVGMKTREPGDVALEHADVLLAIGFDPIEYSPAYWKMKKGCKVIHIDALPADPDALYQPDIELIGDIAANLSELQIQLRRKFSMHSAVKKAQRLLFQEQQAGERLEGKKIHPLRFIADLRSVINDDTTVISDVGSHQVWLAKYFFCYEPKHLLFSMGFQTMGISLPWAMATTLVRPGKKVISISGDGSFLMSATELETAVRYSMPLVHVIWRDGGYNLVEIQQLEAYKKSFGVHFTDPDFVAFAKSFGAEGFRISRADEIIPMLKKAFAVKGPCIIDVPIDYSQNLSLLQPGELAFLR